MGGANVLSIRLPRTDAVKKWPESVASFRRLGLLRRWRHERDPNDDHFKFSRPHDAVCWLGTKGARVLESRRPRETNNGSGGLQPAATFGFVELTALAFTALFIWLTYSAVAPWLGRYAMPGNACAAWDGADLAPPFQSQGARGYLAAMSNYEDMSDNGANPRRSPAFLCEDGAVIGPAHSLHDDIRGKGEGRFSLWGGALYFSSRDNSDPNSNGRHYRVLIPPMWYRICLVVTL